jgi:hypothetical protein
MGQELLGTNAFPRKLKKVSLVFHQHYKKSPHDARANVSPNVETKVALQKIHISSDDREEGKPLMRLGC